MGLFCHFIGKLVSVEIRGIAVFPIKRADISVVTKREAYSTVSSRKRWHLIFLSEIEVFCKKNSKEVFYS